MPHPGDVSLSLQLLEDYKHWRCYLADSKGQPPVGAPYAKPHGYSEPIWQKGPVLRSSCPLKVGCAGAESVFRCRVKADRAAGLMVGIAFSISDLCSPVNTARTIGGTSHFFAWYKVNSILMCVEEAH